MTQPLVTGSQSLQGFDQFRHEFLLRSLGGVGEGDDLLESDGTEFVFHESLVRVDKLMLELRRQERKERVRPLEEMIQDLVEGEGGEDGR
jgi:hypothetical protein